MGVRPHKIIGYGVEKAASLPRDRMELSYETSISEFASWALKQWEEISRLVGEKEAVRGRLLFDLSMEDFIRDGHSGYLSACAQYNGMRSGEEPIVFIPPTCVERWYRYNDDIDWYDETVHHNQENRFVRLDRGLYPYDYGHPPLSIAALLLWLRVPHLWGQLVECLCVYWS